MTEQEELERLRYLQLKAKAAQYQAPIQNDATEPSTPSENGIQRFLPMAGAIAGGTIAGPAGLVPGVGTAIRSGSAGLGAGFGEAMNQLISRARGQEAPDTSAEAAKRIATQAGTAAAAEAVVPAAVRGAKKAFEVSKPLASVAGKGLAKVGELISGVPERAFRRLANDPGALFIPKTLKSAGNEFNEALAKEGIDITPSIAEVNDPQLATARRIAKTFMDKVRNGVKSPVPIQRIKATEQVAQPKSFMDMVEVNPKNVDPLVSSKQTISLKGAEKLPPKIDVVDEYPTLPFQPNAGDILKAKRATDRLIAGTSWKDKVGLRNLFNQRTQQNEMFENASGKGAEASKKYARSALAAQFRKLLPETQTGKLSFVKSVALPFMARSVLGNVVSAPITSGLVTSLGSYGVRGAKAALENEIAMRAILNAIGGRISKENG
jgi:hypothetical protein